MIVGVFATGRYGYPSNVGAVDPVGVVVEAADEVAEVALDAEEVVVG